jgi:DNA-binding transcriptional LysR family regulator
MGVELPTLEAIKRFVAMGHGVALIPGLCVEHELARRELVAVPVKELRMERKLRIVSRKRASHSHAAQAFLKVAEQFSREHERYLFQNERS